MTSHQSFPIAFTLAVAAVAHPTFAAADDSSYGFRAGTYRCELNQQVNVRRVAPDMKTAVIHWNKRDHNLQAVGTRTGALRFEDAKSGLVWIMIPGKSMLLDSKRGQRLADECRV